MCLSKPTSCDTLYKKDKSNSKNNINYLDVDIYTTLYFV